MNMMIGAAVYLILALAVVVASVGHSKAIDLDERALRLGGALVAKMGFPAYRGRSMRRSDERGGAAPAGEARNLALGRLRDPARVPLRARREELAALAGANAGSRNAVRG